MVDVHGGELGIDPPVMPAGREVELPGRGRTFVRQLPGPEEAPTIVLLHGWTATADLNWVSCYAGLAEQFNVVALDHRGHGRGLQSDEPFRLADCADDVAALVDVLGLDPVIAVGYSMGGPIAQLLWQRHPDVVAGLVLCATSCTFGGTPRETILFRVADGTAAVVGHFPLAPLTRAAVGALGRWRAMRGKPWWGFAEVARHDWAQIVEAGRELGRFDSRPWIDGIDVPDRRGRHRPRRRRPRASPTRPLQPPRRRHPAPRRRRPRRVHARPRALSPRPARRVPLRHAAAPPRCRVTADRPTVTGTQRVGHRVA